MFDTMKVAKEIREARIAQNMTQMNLADEMGVSYQAVSNWERGGSMPDIGKLEELCRILNLSLDQLLGARRQVTNVQKVMDYTNGKSEEALSLEAIGDAAPLMKPDSLNHLAKEIQDEEVAAIELCGLAPFLGKEVLGELAIRIKEVTLGELCGLAPFLEKEILGELAIRIKEVTLGELCGLAPFLDKEMLETLAERITDEEVDLGELCGIAPFLEKEAVAALAGRIPADRINLDELCGLAPFMEKEALEQLVKERYR